MKKVLSYFLVLIISCYSLNLITFMIFGKSALLKQILSDTHTSYREYQWTSDVNFASNLNLKANQINLVKDFYRGTKADFKYLEVQGIDDIEDIFYSQDKYVHFLEAEFNIWVVTYSIDESEKIAEYYHGYRRVYCWLFIDWVMIDELFLGIT